MALAPLVKGASGRRPVFEPWTGIRGALQYGEVCPSQDSARFSEGKNLANRDEESFVLHRGAAALRAAPAYSCIDAWRTPVLNGRPGSFHASEIAFTFDNALKSVITIAVAFQRHSSCQNKLVMRGRILLEPEILVTVACRVGLRTDRSAVRCTSTRLSCSQRCRTRRIEADALL